MTGYPSFLTQNRASSFFLFYMCASLHFFWTFVELGMWIIVVVQSESAQGEAAANAMAGRGGGAFRGRGRGMRRR